MDKEYIESPFTFDTIPSPMEIISIELEKIDKLVYRVNTLERMCAELNNRIDYLTTFVRDYCINSEIKENEE